MRWRILFLGVVGASLGLLAEAALYGFGDPGHWVPDLIVGWTFVATGLVGWSRRPKTDYLSLFFTLFEQPTLK